MSSGRYLLLQGVTRACAQELLLDCHIVFRRDQASGILTRICHKHQASADQQRPPEPEGNEKFDLESGGPSYGSCRQDGVSANSLAGFDRASTHEAGGASTSEATVDLALPRERISSTSLFALMFLVVAVVLLWFVIMVFHAVTSSRNIVEVGGHGAFNTLARIAMLSD
ncbi:hypothetical protein DOTSEDRAFT_72845 [Dothistroma septosporum NZE10]|uniref:Uncharacterized protein n=1 Tax=Dothistroma septosporum (strain NZE10 / CBS 128990) TaxID=675120 RepID=M2YNL5_DOTSN|nr:hypothetical protein DOTSEDRAFT_72845 [Dothistroma septosporum NZE10]